MESINLNLDEYVDIILKEVSNYVHRENIVFMSFDANIINELHKRAPQYKLSLPDLRPI